MTLGLVDILFLITVVLLVFNGLRNGAIFSLVSLIGLPIGLGVAYYYGPQFTRLLAQNGLPATPLISYIILFFGSVFIVHIVGNMIRSVVKRIPLISQGDTLLGGAIGFVEAWLLWLFLLMLLGVFLGSVQTTINQGTHIVPGLNVQVTQFQSWHDFYNQAVNNSLFARVNSLFVKALPTLPAAS
ncbi:MAG: hypothetical protein NVS2B12_38400 [Ktedonobacteraceae bacterium]